MPSNLLLLDEPTNHLDIPAREAIEAFMRESPATLLVVSPRPAPARDDLRPRCGSSTTGSPSPFDGGYRAWRAAVADGWTVAGGDRGEAERLRTGGRPAGGRSRRRGRDGRRAAHGSRGPGAAPAVASRRAVAPVAATRPATGRAGRPTRPKLSKEAYRRQRAALDAELTRLGLRKSHLELAMGDPAVAANFVEMRRVTSELADVRAALAAAEEAWLELEERAP